jgi:hypothetical protein
MAVKHHKKPKGRRRRLHHTVKGGLSRMRKKTDPVVSDQPASGATMHNDHAGVLRFDDQHLHLPEALAEAGENEGEGVMSGRVMLVITILAIVFIAVIAWFVSQMPEK